MRVFFGVLTVAVIVHGFLLLVQAQAIGDLNNKDLAALLEEALKRLRENEEEKDGQQPPTLINLDLESLAANITNSLQQLTDAVINNTKEIMMKKSPTDASENALSEPVECELPFFPVKSECFYVNKYKRVSWSEARKFCKGLGSDLAEPARVNTLRAMLLDKFPDDDNKFFWVGATETGIEGNWTWVSSRRVQPADWAPGQPDGGNENCVVLSRDDFPPLHDSPCYTHTMFICERLVLHRQ